MHQMPRTKMLQMARRRQWCPTMANIFGIFVGLTTLQMQLTWAGTNLQCLVDFKNSIHDPSNMLSSWFTNNVSVENNICYWQGVSCFSDMASSVYNISVSNMGLSGTWPSGLQLCPSLQSLNLSGNSFTGPIPTTISSDIPNLVYLDVSNNSLGGSIPVDLGSCQFLNDVILNDNRLTGDIPASITQLKRLAVFDVYNIQLSGLIPSILNGSGKSFKASSYAGNTYLCGKPLTRNCSTTDTNQSVISVPGFFVGIGIGIGFLTGMALFVKLWHLRLSHFFGRSNRMDKSLPKWRYGLVKHPR